MKLFDVSESANGNQCGGCNWEATKRYWMAETQEQADQEVSKMNPEIMKAYGKKAYAKKLRRKKLCTEK
ncbi:unnamed protein product [marine sediment metagenome]|uniref:Uncharacterized protein n=1 Tax=marine sediment metagenome TaxID=412755 RepID=X1EEW6_9ZZZZ